MKSKYLFIISIILGSCQDHLSAHLSGLSIIDQLKEGNKRFLQGKPMRHASLQRLDALSQEQHPKAVLITCADSRISPAILFDTEIGDLFVIKTAGNFIDEIEMGSIEYAVKNLHTPLLIIMGHTNCGAIRAVATHLQEQGHIQSILDSISNEIEIKDLIACHDENINHMVEANVLHQYKAVIERSVIIKDALATNKLEIKQVLLNTETGKINFN